jgi:hypothetical protein
MKAVEKVGARRVTRKRPAGIQSGIFTHAQQRTRPSAARSIHA